MSNSYENSFKAYLQFERNMSSNTIEAYLHDVDFLINYLAITEPGLKLEAIELSHIQDFLKHINEKEFAVASQARLISGIRSFFIYLRLENIISKDPTELLEAPKQQRHLPTVLSIADIEAIFSVIDLSTADGQRNRAMLETLYSSGLRVSELTGLLISNLYLDTGFLRIIGKGNKERLVPIGGSAIKHIQLYQEHYRKHQKINAKSTDILFLNLRGGGLSRVSVFNIIKQAVAQSGIRKNVHPHTFRHSFATHLVEQGADLRAVQEMLGHKSITTTEIYTHLDRHYLRTTLEQFHPRF